MRTGQGTCRRARRSSGGHGARHLRRMGALGRRPLHLRLCRAVRKSGPRTCPPTAGGLHAVRRPRAGTILGVRRPLAWLTSRFHAAARAVDAQRSSSPFPSASGFHEAGSSLRTPRSRTPPRPGRRPSAITRSLRSSTTARPGPERCDHPRDPATRSPAEPRLTSNSDRPDEPATSRSRGTRSPPDATAGRSRPAPAHEIPHLTSTESRQRTDEDS